jgi:hypothetical protein
MIRDPGSALLVPDGHKLACDRLFAMLARAAPSG